MCQSWLFVHGEFGLLVLIPDADVQVAEDLLVLPKGTGSHHHFCNGGSGSRWCQDPGVYTLFTPQILPCGRSLPPRLHWDSQARQQAGPDGLPPALLQKDSVCRPRPQGYPFRTNSLPANCKAKSCPIFCSVISVRLRTSEDWSCNMQMKSKLKTTVTFQTYLGPLLQGKSWTEPCS